MMPWLSGSLKRDHYVCFEMKLPKCFEKKAVMALFVRPLDNLSFVVYAVSISLETMSLRIMDSTDFLELEVYLSMMARMSHGVFNEAQKTISTSRNMCRFAKSAIFRMMFCFSTAG